MENPETNGSSHGCSECGFYVEDMPLSKRTFHCPSCGFLCHRDKNSAINHLNNTSGMRKLTPVEILPLPLRSAKASCVVEAGTIFENI